MNGLERGCLERLPLPLKVIVTVFLAFMGFGYLAALGNLYHQHRLADGKAGLSLDDLRVTFHGLQVTDTPVASAATGQPKSRMLEMIEPGGEMRKELDGGGLPAIRALETWLQRGATKEEFLKTGLAQAGDPSAEAVIARHCLRCHNAEDGEKQDAPYGPDLFTTDYDQTYKFAAAGTGVNKPAAPAAGGARTVGPMPLSHLFLITHIHMLSIPVFTILVSGLFWLTPYYPQWTRWITPVPMLCLVADFASWWLSRIVELFIFVTAAAGALYAASLAVQLVTVTWAMWFGPRDSQTPEITESPHVG